MIQSKHDLDEYLKADKVALGRKTKKPKFYDLIWKYEISLRECEYLTNISKKQPWHRIVLLWYKYRKFTLEVKCGFSIPINSVGKGLCLAHMGTVIINDNARIGENCRIHAGVNIGADFRNSDSAPQIGNDVYIGPGAKLFGNIVIADGIAIGANAVVNKSFIEKHISVAGVPAKKVSDNGTEGVLF